MLDMKFLLIHIKDFVYITIKHKILFDEQDHHKLYLSEFLFDL